LDVVYVGTTRTVNLLEGEAYFTVRHDGRRPFMVHAGTLRLTDIGTSFDVRRSGERVDVSVSEGVVDVQTSLAASAKSLTMPATDELPSLRLHAGERVTSDPEHKSPVITKVAADQTASWRTGRLTFQDEPLLLVISNINRYATREVVIVDPEISAMRFTGTVFEDHVDEWVTGTMDLFHLRGEATADGKLLLYLGEPQHKTGDHTASHSIVSESSVAKR
jgi:transmembrane sensor